MSNSVYGQVRGEQVWVARQAVQGTPAAAKPTDAVIMRGRATLPSVLTDRVPSQEVRATAPDIDQLINRKKPPGAFELPCYAKAPAVAGHPPQWGVLLENGMGIEAHTLTVVAFAGLTGKTVTVTVAGTPTVLTEGGGWTAATSNDATATSLAAAIDALPAMHASAVGPVVTVTRDIGAAGEFTITSNAAVANLTSSLDYALATDILDNFLTIYHLADNVLRVFRDSHTSSAEWQVSGSDEGTIRFRGFVGNETQVGYHTLSANILSGATSLVTVEDLRVLLGPNPEDVVYVKIDNEEFKVTAADYGTRTLTVVGAQNLTIAAPHNLGAAITPVLPGPDPDPNDTILPMTLGSFVLGGTTYRVAEATVTQDEHLTPRIDEWAEFALTGYKRPLTGREVNTSFIAYQQRTVLPLLNQAERGVQAVLVITIGKVGGPQIILTLPIHQIRTPTIGERGGEFSQTFTGMGLASTVPGNDGIRVSVRAA